MPRMNPRRFPWRVGDVLVCCAAAGLAYWGGRVRGSTADAAGALAASLVLGAGFGLPPALVLLARRASPLRLWFPAARLGRDAASGAVLFFLLASLNAMHVIYRMPAPPPRGGLDELVWRSGRPAEVAELLLAFGVVGPVAEEVFFRGMLYPAMRRVGAVVPAVIASSAVFAFWHMRHLQLHAFLLGIVAAIFVEYTGSLLPAIAAHMGVNLAYVALLADRAGVAQRVPIWAAGAVFAALNAALFALGPALFSPERPLAPPPTSAGDAPLAACADLPRADAAAPGPEGGETTEGDGA